MPWRNTRLSKKGCGFATPECRAQRDVAVHPRPAPPPPLLAAPRPSTTALGYLEIRWVVRSSGSGRPEATGGEPCARAGLRPPAHDRGRDRAGGGAGPLGCLKAQGPIAEPDDGADVPRAEAVPQPR